MALLSDMSFSSFLAQCLCNGEESHRPGVRAGNSGGICAMPESQGLHCPLVPEWNLRKAHYDAHGIDLVFGGRTGRVSPRVIFLKSHQARQLPSVALCCLEQKTQALGHYLGPLYTAFSFISLQRLPPKYLRVCGKSEPPPEALTLLWRSFPAGIPSLPPSCHCKEGPN